MKKLLLVGLVVSAMNVSAKEAHNVELKFVGDLAYSNFCKAAVQDNVSLMRTTFANKVGEVGRSRKDVYRKLLQDQNLTCNGMGIIEFSKQRQAERVAAYLQAKVEDL